MKTTLFYGVKYFTEGFGLPRIANCPVGGIFVCRGIAQLPAQGVQVISGLSGGAALSLGVTILCDQLFLRRKYPRTNESGIGGNMKVFMLGWEFPPFISGGLGTACYGLTKAMNNLGLKVTFCLPKMLEDKYTTHVKLLSPNSLSPAVSSRINKLTNVLFRTINSPLQPYSSPDVYQQRIEETLRQKHIDGNSVHKAGEFAESGPPLKITLQNHGNSEVRKLRWKDSATKCVSIYKETLVAV